VTVRDTGAWRPPPADPGFRGRGLQLIGRLAIDLDVRRRAEGTTVHFRIGRSVRGGEAAVARGEELLIGDRPAVVRATDRPGGRCLELSGDLDLAGVADVRDTVRGWLLAEDRPAALELTGLGHVSSIGMGLLREIVQLTGDRGVLLEVVLPGDGAARRALDLTGLTDVLRGGG
jgi:anti-anti-sigma factor